MPNLPVLEDAAAGHGSFTVVGGRDQVVRRLPVLVRFGDELVPSLALEALRVAEGDSTIRVRVERAGGAVAGLTVRVGEATVPLDAAGGLWLHHTDPAPGRGLTGARERVEALEGRFAAGPVADSFIVEAEIPAGARD